jgi:hypothetical protein
VFNRFKLGEKQYVINMLNYLKTIKTNLLTVQDGHVKTAQDVEVTLNALPQSFQMLCSSIYDAQNEEFQKFLKVASVVGKDFSLEEVAAILTEGYEKLFNNTVARLSKVVKVHNCDKIIEPKEMPSSKSPINVFSNVYKFTASDMRDSIYMNRLTESERQSMHLKLVRFYETKLTIDNEPTFVPKICFHYNLANVKDRDSILQCIRYMVMLGTYLCQRAEMYQEAIAVYTKLQSIVEKFQLESVLGPTAMSEIHIQLGHAYRHGLPTQVNKIQSLRHLMIAIDTLEYRWPKTNSDWILLYIKEVSLWGWSTLTKIFRKNRKQKIKKTDDSFLNRLLRRDIYTKNQKLERLEHIQPILENMARNLFEMDANMRDIIGIDLLLLNQSFRMGMAVKSSSKLILSFAMSFWFSGNRKIAIKLASSTTEVEFDAFTCFKCSTFWTLVGNWRRGELLAESGLQKSKVIGDFTTWIRCMRLKSFIKYFNGEFSQVLKLENEKIEQSQFYGHPKFKASGILSM